MRCTIAISVALTVTLPLAAAEDARFDPARLAAAVAPYVDEETAFVIHADLRGLDPERLAARVAAATGMEANSVARLFSGVDHKALDRLLDAGVRDVFVVGAASDLNVGPALVVPLGEAANAKAVEEEMGRHHGSAERVGRTVLAGPPEVLERLKKLKPAKRPDAAEAFRAAGPGAVQLAVLPTPDARRVLEELLPTLPREVGGGPITTYTRGIRWLALGLQTDPQLHLNLTITCPDKDAAQKLEESLRRLVQASVRGLLYAVVGSKEGDKLPVPDKLSPRLVPRAEGARLTLALDEKTLADIVRSTLPPVLRSASRNQSANNLRNLVIALHNYHDAYGRFPTAASRDKDGKPLLSWRVHVLPFLAQNELYKEFHLDEPWDSEHNKKLIARMPKVFDSTGDPKLAAAGKTTYLGPVGKQMMFPLGKQGLRITDVTDGTSWTIFVVDADDAHAVTWSKPGDLDVDLADPAKGLSARFSTVYLAAFVDGSVHFLPRTIDKARLRALFTRNGGEVIDKP
jgi:hypothetical protein